MTSKTVLALVAVAYAAGLLATGGCASNPDKDKPLYAPSVHKETLQTIYYDDGKPRSERTYKYGILNGLSSTW